MTEKWYETKPYTTAWSTEITSIKEQEDHVLVTLRETAFYPEGGGQPSDYGTINGVDVLDVFEQDDEIYHKLPQAPDRKEADCRLDWARRFDHMQHHTGQHLLSAVCIELYDAHTVSFHLGADTVTIDLAVPSLSAEQLDHIEQRVNECIYENKEIRTYYVTKENVHTVPLRKLPDVGDNIRIVEIVGIDYSACCGTHVSRTGEIGMIKLLRTEKQRGNVRLHFKCGLRALIDYRLAHDALSALAGKFSTSRSEVVERIEKLEQEQKQLQKEMEQLKTEKAAYITNELIANSKGRIVTLVSGDQPIKNLQSIIKSILGKGDYIVLFASTIENKLVMAHNGFSSVHCGQLFKEQLSAFNGRGGGNANQAQAGFSTKEEMENFFSFLQRTIN
ncbi:MAG TPA: DHHA1 domain-containing protein [Bacillus sp. (in: firmicutes)]|nr:DHHA1 domain-containing protein [Bacillus sp. (in: firmicutes)]